MKYLKPTFGILVFTILVFAVTSCKNETKKVDVKEVIVNKAETKNENIQNYSVGSQIPNKLILLVIKKLIKLKPILY